MSARQQRVGGGLTNVSKPGQVEVRQQRAPPAHIMGEAGGDRPGTGGSATQRPYTPADSEGSRGRLSSRGGAPPRSPHVTLNGTGQILGDADMRASMRSGGSSARNERRKDELFGPPSPHPASARGGASSRPNTAPDYISRSLSRSSTQDLQATLKLDPMIMHAGGGNGSLRPATSESNASSVVEARLVQFQKSFVNKNSAKCRNLQDAFRRSDTNKNGTLGAEEIADAMKSLDIPVDNAVINRLLARGVDPQGLNFQEFRDQLWMDSKMDSYIGKGDSAGGGSGDNSKAKFLWTPLKNPLRSVGTINDTLEQDRIDAGMVHERLDGNFSSVAYNILSFNPASKPVPPTVRIPVKNRVKLFDPPPPLGRRVAYDRGDSPYDVINLSEGLLGVHKQDDARARVFQAPVRITTFARSQMGEYPTQQAHMLTKTFY